MKSSQRRWTAGLALALVFTGAALTRGADPAPAPASARPATADPDALAAKVHAIFDAKCAACHSPKAKKVKKFDTVLDFDKLRANPKLIVPGNPVESAIFKSIEEEEMPPQDKEPIYPLLTPDERTAVHDWIAAGAPAGKTAATTVASAATTNPAAAGTTAPKGKPFFEKLVRWLGNFHPLAAHTPIAVLMAAAIAEILYVRYRAPALTAAARFCAVLGGLGALATAGLGWLMYVYHTSMDPVLQNHKQAGTIAGLAAIPIALLGEWGARRAHRAGREWHGPTRWAFRFLVFGIAGFVGYTAHLGGLAHWGENFFDWPK